MTQPNRRLYLLVFGLSLAAHLLPLALSLADPARAYTAGDSRDWDWLARNLIEHGVYSRSLAAPFQPEVFRAPLYPVFVAGLYALAGLSLPAVLIAQAILAAAAMALLFALARRLGLPPGAALAGVAAANLLPISLLFWGTLASENLAVFFLLLGLVLAWDGDRSRQYLTGFGAGAAGGLMALARPIGLLLLPALGAGAIWGRAPRRAAARLALAALGAAVALGPWLWRNQKIFGHPAISTVSGVNLLTYNAAAVLARRAGLGFWEGRYLMWAYWDDYYARLETKPANEVEDSLAMQAAALDIIWSNPLEFAWVNTLESLNSLRPGVAQLTAYLVPGVFDDTNPEGDISPAAESLTEPVTRLLAVGLTGFYGVVFLLCGAGALAALARRDWPFLLAVVLPVAILLLSPGPVANSRFRVPAEPLLAVMGVEGARAIDALVKRHRGLREM